MTTAELYERLREQAMRERSSSQVWHEADIDGHHLYMADTSFGDGPIFRLDNHAWEIAYDDVPITRDTTPEHLAMALSFAERATWRSRFVDLDPEQGTARTLTISVKGPDGEWTTLNVLEMRVAQPVVMYSDTGGVVAIRSGGMDVPSPPEPA